MEEQNYSSMYVNRQFLLSLSLSLCLLLRYKYEVISTAFVIPSSCLVVIRICYSVYSVEEYVVRRTCLWIISR